MSKVSATDSLASLLDTGLNSAQRKGASEDGAGLFAAMLQDIPADGEAVAAAATAASGDVAAEGAPVGAAAVPAAAVLTDAEAASAAALAAASTAAADADATPASRESVQLFEDQLALHNRFSDAGRGETTDKKAAEHKQQPILVSSDDTSPAERKDTATAKDKKHAADTAIDPHAETLPDTAAATNKAETAAPTRLLATADGAAQAQANTGNKTPAAATATAVEAPFENDTAMHYATADNAANGRNARNASRPGTDASAYAGVTNGVTGGGKGQPQSGKTSPAGKDEHARLQQNNNAGLTLPGFTAVASGEDSGFSFADVAAQTLAAASDADNVQTTATASAAGSFTLAAARDPAQDGVTPELLPDSATALLDAANPMGSDAWVEDTATQLSWLREQGLEKAHIKLHPEDLGALDISISIEDGQTYVQILTSTPEARELLQSSLPNLRDLLQQSGLALAEGYVAQGDAQNSQGFEQTAQQQHAFVDAKELPPQANNWTRPAAQGRSQVDYYI